MELTRANEAVTSIELDPQFGRGPVRQCVVVDRVGKRMVMPRYSAAEAIEQIARAIAGRNASSEQKRHAWERLRDQHGFAVKWIQPKRAGGASIR